MVRRSFRIGLRVGVLFGAAFALVKTVQSRRAKPAPETPAPWEPMPRTGHIPTRSPVADDAPVDEVGEPVLEPTPPEPEPAPAPAPAPAASGAPKGTPPEADLLNAGVESSPEAAEADPRDVLPEQPATPQPIRPRRGPTARKAAPARNDAPPSAAPAGAATAWVEAEGGICPPTHPVKAKLTSRLFHLPGMFAYDRTRPDRCYLDADAAVADGFTAAKR
jgi:hypothetical protein